MYNLKEINSTPFIYGTLEKVLEERSEYLKRLYYSIAPRTSLGGTYLDIGAGNPINGKVFGKSFKEVILLDLNPIPLTKETRNIRSLVGDARNLPFEDNSADLITLISTIEHIPNPWKAIEEAERVIKSRGDIIIQFPNPLFPLDLHTGIVNPFWIPKKYRKAYTTFFGFPDYIKEVFSLPKVEDLLSWFSLNIYLIDFKEVVYPPHFIPKLIRPFYWVLYKLKILNLVPLGYLYVFRKR